MKGHLRTLDIKRLKTGQAVRIADKAFRAALVDLRTAQVAHKEATLGFYRAEAKEARKQCQPSK